MIYKWKSINYSIPAQDVGELFEQIEEKYGEITSARVLDEARPENSLLHPIFEWSDTIAAEKYRLEQARHLITNIRIETSDSEEHKQPLTINAYVKANEEKTARYVNIRKAFQDADMRRTVLHDAIRELNAFEEKYKKFSEFDELFNVIHKLNVA